jgi:hypothetical protein
MNGASDHQCERVPVGDWSQLGWRRLDEVTAGLARHPFLSLYLLASAVSGSPPGAPAIERLLLAL